MKTPCYRVVSMPSAGFQVVSRLSVRLAAATHLAHVDLCCLLDSQNALSAVESLLSRALPFWRRRMLFEVGTKHTEEDVYIWLKHYVLMMELDSFDPDLPSLQQLESNVLEETMRDHDIIEVKIRVFVLVSGERSHRA